MQFSRFSPFIRQHRRMVFVGEMEKTKKKKWKKFYFLGVFVGREDLAPRIFIFVEDRNLAFLPFNRKLKFSLSDYKFKFFLIHTEKVMHQSEE